MFKRALVFGASRGLGKALTETIPKAFAGIEVVGVSRKGPNNLTLDLSKFDDQSKACEIAHSFDLVIYAAGGGPYGTFSDKDWKDHSWAIQVGLVAPMRIVHHWLKVKKPGMFVIVGSAIAELKPDPKAASYAASKSGLHGFVSSLQDELKESAMKIGLFSPGYMDTEMLPSTASVRRNGARINAPLLAAEDLLRWIKEGNSWHRIFDGE